MEKVVSCLRCQALVSFKDIIYILCILHWQKLGPHANVGFSKAMSAGWLQVNKKAEGGPRVLRKVTNTSTIKCLIKLLWRKNIENVKVFL